MTMSVATTGSMPTQNYHAAASQIHGIALVAVRLGRALQAWGERTAQPPTREQLERHIAMQREAHEAQAAHRDLRNGISRLG